ncbi:MAG: DUF1674 domain-containing protein [Robiginitomaculum sp.]|nr:MAG: DUF1674 domain-containing protein [Robiginitomaculum sp.]
MTNPPHAAPGKTLSQNAIKALEEAAARRQARDANAVDAKPIPKETAGPKGVEPTRYGDWERGGITYDF